MTTTRTRLAGFAVVVLAVAIGSSCSSDDQQTSKKTSEVGGTATATETSASETRATEDTGELETQVREELAVLREMGTITLIQDSIAGGTRPRALISATDEAFKNGTITEIGLCISLVTIREATRSPGGDVSDNKIVDECVMALAEEAN